MSARRNDHNDLYIRRLDEKIQEADLAAMAAWGRNVDLATAIDHRNRSSELSRLLDRILEQRASIRRSMASFLLADVVDTATWRRQFDDASITGREAPAELTALRDAIGEERRHWSTDDGLLEGTLAGLVLSIDLLLADVRRYHHTL